MLLIVSWILYPSVCSFLSGTSLRVLYFAGKGIPSYNIPSSFILSFPFFFFVQILPFPFAELPASAVFGRRNCGQLESQGNDLVQVSNVFYDVSFLEFFLCFSNVFDRLISESCFTCWKKREMDVPIFTFIWL